MNEKETNAIEILEQMDQMLSSSTVALHHGILMECDHQVKDQNHLQDQECDQVECDQECGQVECNQECEVTKAINY